MPSVTRVRSVQDSDLEYLAQSICQAYSLGMQLGFGLAFPLRILLFYPFALPLCPHRTRFVFLLGHWEPRLDTQLRPKPTLAPEPARSEG